MLLLQKLDSSGAAAAVLCFLARGADCNNVSFSSGALQLCVLQQRCIVYMRSKWKWLFENAAIAFRLDSPRTFGSISRTWPNALDRRIA